MEATGIDLNEPKNESELMEAFSYFEQLWYAVITILSVSVQSDGIDKINQLALLFFRAIRTLWKELFEFLTFGKCITSSFMESFF